MTWFAVCVLLLVFPWPKVGLLHFCIHGTGIPIVCKSHPLSTNLSISHVANHYWHRGAAKATERIGDSEERSWWANLIKNVLLASYNYTDIFVTKDFYQLNKLSSSNQCTWKIWSNVCMIHSYACRHSTIEEERQANETHNCLRVTAWVNYSDDQHSRSPHCCKG